MNNFLNFFDNNQSGEDDLMCPRVSFEHTNNLSPVAGHIGVSYRGCLLIWGGYFCSEDQLVYREPENLYVYPYGLTGNFNVWLKIKCTSKTVMKPNCGSSGLVHNDDMYIFGGTTTVNETFTRSRPLPASTMYKLDLKSGIFEFVALPVEQRIPTPRDKAASWTVGDKLYYFGGYGVRLDRLENIDAYLFADTNDYKEGNDGGRHVWNNQLLEFDIQKREWHLIPKSGDVPSQRAAAGASYIQDLHSVFLFGGRDEKSRLNDLYKLDMLSMHWTKVEIEGEKPMARSWSSFTALPERNLIVMQGGFSINDHPLDDIWYLDLSELYDTEKCRNKNAQVKWICIRQPTTTNNSIDQNGNNVNGEMEIEEAVESNNPFRRFWHTSNLVSDAIIIYGGMSQIPSVTGQCLNTLHVLRSEPPSLFNSCLRNLKRIHLPELPSSYILNLKRKITLLEEMQRFSQRKNSFYLKCSDRHCPSLYELKLSEIFDILDLDKIFDIHD